MRRSGVRSSSSPPNSKGHPCGGLLNLWDRVGAHSPEFDHWTAGGCPVGRQSTLNGLAVPRGHSTWRRGMRGSQRQCDIRTTSSSSPLFARCVACSGNRQKIEILPGRHHDTVITQSGGFCKSPLSSHKIRSNGRAHHGKTGHPHRRRAQSHRHLFAGGALRRHRLSCRPDRSRSRDHANGDGHRCADPARVRKSEGGGRSCGRQRSTMSSSSPCT